MVFWFLGTAALEAQTFRLVGAVADAATGRALQVPIILEPTNQKTESDAKGNYQFTRLKAGPYTVRIHVGNYLPYRKEVEIRTQDVLVDVELVPLRETAIEPSPEPRVTRLASISRPEVYSEKDALEDSPPPSKPSANLDTPVLLASQHQTPTPWAFSEAVLGACEGLIVTRNSGAQGTQVRIQVQAGGGLLHNRLPLVVVDGLRIPIAFPASFQVGGQVLDPFVHLAPEDIADLTCLTGRDATFAFGASAADGVLRITTKQGQNHAPQIRYVARLGTQEASDFGTEATDRLLKTGLVGQHQVQIRGGDTRFWYFGSAGRLQSNSPFPQNDWKRHQARLNISVQPVPKLFVAGRLAWSQSENALPQEGISIWGTWVNTQTQLASNRFPFADSSAIFQFKTLYKSQQATANLQADWFPRDGLSLKLNLGQVQTDLSGAQSRPYSQRFGLTQPIQAARARTEQRFGHTTFEASLRYEYEVMQDISGQTQVLGQALQAQTTGLEATAERFAQTELGLLQNGQLGQNMAESELRLREAGAGLAQMFRWKSLFSLEGVGRWDWANRLNKVAKPLFYNGLKAELNLLEGLPRFTQAWKELSISAGWGTAGRLPAPTDAWGLRWQVAEGLFGNRYEVVQRGNPDIEPETVTRLDLRVKGEKNETFRFSLARFRETTEKAILYVEMPPSEGLNGLVKPQNLGEMQSKGLQADLFVRALALDRVRLFIKADFFTLHTEVKSLGLLTEIADGSGLNRVRVGSPRSGFWAEQVTGANFDDNGVFTGAHLAKTNDLVNGQSVDSQGRAFLGQAEPKFGGNLSLRANLGRGGLAELRFKGLGGHLKYNQTKRYQVLRGEDANFQTLSAQLGFSTVAGVARLTANTPEYRQAAEQYASLDPNYPANFIEAADFIKGERLYVGYDLRQIQALGLRLPLLTVGVWVQHFATWTRYSGLDPETQFLGTPSLTQGHDFFNFPTPRFLMFEINAQF